MAMRMVKNICQRNSSLDANHTNNFVVLNLASNAGYGSASSQETLHRLDDLIYDVEDNVTILG